MLKWIRTGAALALLAGLGCKPTSQSSLQTLDNFAAQKRLKDNSCAGRPNDQYLPSVEAIMSRVSGSTDIEVMGAVRSAVAAVPETLRSLFLALDGTIKLDSNPRRFCGDAKGGNSAGQETYSCFAFRELTAGGGVAIVAKNHPDAINHSLVRQFGYFYAQYLSKHSYEYDASGRVTKAARSDNPGLRARKTAVANAFLSDVDLSPYFDLQTMETFLHPGAVELIRKSMKQGDADYLSLVKSDQVTKESFTDFIFAEAFDSFFCNAYAPIPEDLFDGVKNRVSLSESDLKGILKQTNNTRTIMAVLFEQTIMVFNQIYPELFLGMEPPKPTDGKSAQGSLSLVQSENCGVVPSAVGGGSASGAKSHPFLAGGMQPNPVFPGGPPRLPRPLPVIADAGALKGQGGLPQANKAMVNSLGRMQKGPAFDTQIFKKPVIAPQSQVMPRSGVAGLDSSLRQATAWGDPEPALPNQDRLPNQTGTALAAMYPRATTKTNAAQQSGGDLQGDFLLAMKSPGLNLYPVSSASAAGGFALAGGGIFSQLGKKCASLFGASADDAADAAKGIKRTNQALGDVGGAGNAGKVEDIFNQPNRVKHLAELAGKTLPADVPKRLEPITPQMLRPGDDAIFFSQSGNLYSGSVRAAPSGGSVHLVEGGALNLARIGEGGILRKGENMTFTSKSGNQYSGLVTNALPEKKMIQIMADDGQLNWLNAERIDFAKSGVRGKSIDEAKFAKATATGSPDAGYVPGTYFSGYHAPNMAPTPDQGWKLHVSAPLGKEGDVAEAVLPELRKLGIQHKVATPQGYGRLFATDATGAPGTQQGKLVTIYPKNEAEAAAVARAMRQTLDKEGLSTQKFVEIPGEREVAPGVYARYGQFRAHADLPMGKIRTPDGQIVPDTRGQYKPDWVQDLRLD